MFSKTVAAFGAVLAAASALATETSTYDESTLELLSQTENLLRQEGTQLSFTSTSTAGFYEQNASSTDCLTDGEIPFVSSCYDLSDSRYLVRTADTFTWTFDGQKTLEDVRFWTQWPDGYRTDITIASIDVTYDGTTWEALGDSTFSASKDESANTVSPYLGSNRDNTKFRRVRFAADSGDPLAQGIVGLRVVFGAQELDYTSHWEIEAKGEEYFAGETPVVRITGKSGRVAEDGESATETLSVSLPFVGTGDKRATLSVRWGASADALSESRTLDGDFAAGATATVTIEGLVPRTTYYVQVAATVGEETGLSEVVSFKASADPITIISSAPLSGVYQSLEGTQLGLAVNLPGGSWICGGGWEWAQPKQENDCLITAEEKSCFALPLMSTETYEKPERITVSGDIRHSQGAGGIGFWSSIVPRSKAYPIEGDEEGKTEIRRYNARENYTGLVFNPYAKTLQVYSDGKLQGSAVPVEITGEKDFHTLTYTINTATGELEWVLLNGRKVRGLVSSAFTEANTSYVGFLSYDGGRTDCRVFEFSEGKDIPSEPLLSLSEVDFPIFIGETVTLTATAIDSLSEEPLTVNVAAEECPGATFVKGEFSWTADAPGTYHVTFSARVGAKVDARTVEIRVYALPPSAPEGFKPIYVAGTELAPSGIQFAGSIQAGATNRTDWGLSVNRPRSTWVWNSGYNWAIPQVNGGSSEFNLNNELATVMLSLQNSDVFSKPNEIFVQVAFTFTGRGVVGFWNGLPVEEFGTDVTRGFTGLYFEKPNHMIRLYVAGQAVGDTRRAEFVEGQQTMRFVLDRKQGVIRDVALNEFPVGDFEIPTLTDEMSDFVGLGSHGNGWGQNGRLQFQSFRVSGRPKGGLTVIVR